MPSEPCSIDILDSLPFNTLVKKVATARVLQQGTRFSPDFSPGRHLHACSRQNFVPRIENYTKKMEDISCKGRIDILASLPINTLLKQFCNSKRVATGC